LKPEDQANIKEKFVKWDDQFWTEIYPIAEIFDLEFASSLTKSFILQHISFSYILTGHREYSEDPLRKAEREKAEKALELMINKIENRLTDGFVETPSS